MSEFGVGESGWNWPLTAYVLLGFSVGLVCGVSSAEVTEPLLATLLSFVGLGALFAMVKGTEASRRMVGLLISGFCLAMLVSLALGILLKLNYYDSAGSRWTSPLLRGDSSFGACESIEKACRRGQTHLMRDLIDQYLE